MRTGERTFSLRQRKTSVAIVVGVVILTGLWYLSFARDSQAAGSSGAVGAARCLGRAATIVGNSGNNDIDGTSGPDVIQAGAGNDDVNGGAGNDLICGGAGNDDLDGGLGWDRFSGGPGADDIHQGTGEAIRPTARRSGATDVQGRAGVKQKPRNNSPSCDDDAHPGDPGYDPQCTPTHSGGSGNGGGGGATGGGCDHDAHPDDPGYCNSGGGGASGGGGGSTGGGASGGGGGSSGGCDDDAHPNDLGYDPQCTSSHHDENESGDGDAFENESGTGSESESEGGVTESENESEGGN